jgi:Polysaccharide lyase family 4, domain III
MSSNLIEWREAEPDIRAKEIGQLLQEMNWVSAFAFIQNALTGISVYFTKECEQIHPIATNAPRYNTDTGVWEEYKQEFEAALLKPGENEIQLTVPAGELTSGVVYDYLRLELNEDYSNLRSR